MILPYGLGLGLGPLAGFLLQRDGHPFRSGIAAGVLAAVGLISVVPTLGLSLLAGDVQFALHLLLQVGLTVGLGMAMWRKSVRRYAIWLDKNPGPEEPGQAPSPGADDPNSPPASL